MNDDRIRECYNPPVNTTQTPEDGGDDFTVGTGNLDTTLDTSRTGGMGGMAGTMDTTDTDMAGDNRVTDVTDL